MELRHTHVLVPLQTWYTIKNNLATLEQKSPEVLAISQKGCDVNEISGVVNNLMETVNTNIGDFCTCEAEAPEFEEAAASPPPRDLLLKAHGPCANAVWPQKQRPRRNAPYLTDSRGTSSSSTASTWWTNEYWS